MNLKPKSILKLLYAVSVIAPLLVLVLFLTDKWQSQEEVVQHTLVDRVKEVSDRFTYQLLDTSRLLDIARTKLETEINAGTLTQPSAYKILQDSVGFFDINVHKHQFGVVFYADKSGHIHAEDGNPRDSSIDVTDRAYFKDLNKNPDDKWVIGQHVIGRTTGQPIFHLATALHEANGNFQGVVFAQQQDDEFQELNAYRSDEYPICYVFFQQDGLVSLRIPTVTPCFSPELEAQLYQIVSSDPNELDGGLTLPSDISADGRSYLVSFEKSNVFRMTVVAALPTEFIFWHRCIPSVTPIVLISLIGFLLVSLLFYHLYRYLNRFETARDASLTDELTTLRNRRALDVEFPALWKNVQRDGKPIAVLFIDIDHFKSVNDVHGHEVGDEVLKVIATIIRHGITRATDLVCRWGGEEFVVVLQDTNTEGAIEVAQRIMEAVRDKSIVIRGDASQANPHIKVTVSIGVASMTVTQTTVDADLIDMADKAMLQAKAEGRDRYKVYQG